MWYLSLVVTHFKKYLLYKMGHYFLGILYLTLMVTHFGIYNRILPSCKMILHRTPRVFTLLELLMDERGSVRSVFRGGGAAHGTMPPQGGEEVFSSSVLIWLIYSVLVMKNSLIWRPNLPKESEATSPLKKERGKKVNFA